ncbi:polysialyltransferase family glycosyltransferase [Sporosarcina sp. SAFN-015]|uniref:polysialyltransferase family glycosyltransferase n=1 Tax=Sporosarcina sp. SAFN-015 TaxID=3387274 RepID=UPI003F7E6FC8
MKNNRVYICFTYYHVLVTLVKEISNIGEADIVICDTIPGYMKLFHSLKGTRSFKNVYTFSEKKYRKSNVEKRRFSKIELVFTNYKYKKMIKPNFELKKNTYKEVNIYNDWTYLGYYLRANRIYYNLLEDAMDSYKVLKNYIEIDYKKSLRNRIFGFVYETLYFHGKSKYSKIVEVNNEKDLEIPREKIRVKDKKEMFSKLTEEQKKQIYMIFTMDDDEESSLHGDSVLILSQPLFEDGIVQTKEIQRKVYQDIIDAYCDDLNIFIKPHPRDNFNYRDNFINVRVMNKDLPSEILNFNPNIKYKKAITVTSTSLNSIDFVDDKVYFGFEWLRKYQ